MTIAPSALRGTSDSAYSADVLAQAVTRPAAIQSQPITYIFFNLDEVEFIEAAVARLIPADDRWPGALEVGVTNYIDKQMGGAWGAGERLYRSGPWQVEIKKRSCAGTDSCSGQIEQRRSREACLER